MSEIEIMQMKAKNPKAALVLLLGDVQGGRAVDRMCGGGVRAVLKELFNSPQ